MLPTITPYHPHLAIVGTPAHTLVCTPKEANFYLATLPYLGYDAVATVVEGTIHITTNAPAELFVTAPPVPTT